MNINSKSCPPLLKKNMKRVLYIYLHIPHLDIHPSCSLIFLISPQANVGDEGLKYRTIIVKS